MKHTYYLLRSDPPRRRGSPPRTKTAPCFSAATAWARAAVHRRGDLARGDLGAPRRRSDPGRRAGDIRRASAWRTLSRRTTAGLPPARGGRALGGDRAAARQRPGRSQFDRQLGIASRPPRRRQGLRLDVLRRPPAGATAGRRGVGLAERWATIDLMIDFARSSPPRSIATRPRSSGRPGRRRDRQAATRRGTSRSWRRPGPTAHPARRTIGGARSPHRGVVGNAAALDQLIEGVRGNLYGVLAKS